MRPLASYPSFHLSARVFGIQAVDYRRHGLEQAIMIALQLLAPAMIAANPGASAIGMPPTST